MLDGILNSIRFAHKTPMPVLKKMKLTLIISSLGSGGAERVMMILANYWAQKGWQITLLTLDDGNKKPFYNLYPDITHRPLGVAKNSSNIIQGLTNNFKRVWVLRTAIKKYRGQTIISFMANTNVLTLIAALGLGIPIIVCEHNDPKFSVTNNVWRVLRNLTYPMASRLTVLTQSAVSYFSPAIQLKTSVMPNPVIKPTFNGNFKKDQNGNKIILAMGRLTEQKGFDLLLKAFAEVSSKFPDWFLYIWGEGSLRHPLEKLRDQLGLRDRVQFPGLTKQPYEIMKKADLFVMSSRYEGFPMVLIEAMACGLPVICFDCNGPRDIIRDDVDGVLVPLADVPALSVGLEQLMNDEKKRDRLSTRAPEVIERFGLEKIMGMWEEVLTSSLKVR